MTGTIANCSFCAYGPGPRYFSGSNTNLAGGVLSVAEVRQIAEDHDWPAVKKHVATAIPIATADDLLAVADNPAGCYVLVDDIDLDGQTIEPIGSADAPFTGEFYGQGHRISRYTVETTEPYAGLFGNIAGGRVNGVLAEEGIVSRLQDTNVTVGVGGFAGVIQSKSLVDDCSFTGNVFNNASGKNGGFGGFVGRTDDLPAILRCSAEVEAVDNVSGQPNTGGFVGDHGHGYIVDAYANGPVTGYTNCVGGFAGYVGAAARIATSWCSGQVESQGAYLGAFVGQLHVDGLVTNSCYDNNPNSGMRAQGNASAGGSVPNAGISGVDEMEDPDNFDGFDFDAIWTFGEGYDKPLFLRGLQTVTFDPAGAPCVIASHDYPIGGTYEDLPDDPVWTNHAFLGWFDDLGIPVTPESSVTFDTNRLLHAQWTTDQTVTFDPHGGQCDFMDAVYTIGSPYDVLPAAAREGYVFLGWFTAATGGDMVSAADPVTAEAERTLHAQWTDRQTVAFNAQGGTCATETRGFPFGGKYVDLPVAERDGFTFLGWFSSANRGNQVTTNHHVTAATSRTLWAHWSETGWPEQQTVTFNAQGGTCAMKSMAFDFGGKYAGLPVAEREGFTFLGWFSSAEGGNQVKETSNVTDALARTLYAHWSDSGWPERQSVKFNSQGGTGATATMAFDFGGKYAGLPAAEREGFTFLGWFSLAEGGNQVKETSNVTDALARTLYAHWSDSGWPEQQTVRFSPQGGTCATATMAFAFGGKYAGLPVAEREGFTFLGWFSKAAAGNRVKENNNVTTALSRTLWAHWGVPASGLSISGFALKPTRDVAARDAHWRPIHVLSFEAKAGCVYELQWTPSLGTEWTPLRRWTAEVDGETDVELPSLPSTHTGFFRIRLF